MVKKQTDDKSRPAKNLISDQSVRIAEWTAQVLAAAEQLKIKKKVVDTFVPGKLERTVLSILKTVTPKIRTKMSNGETSFTATEVASMAMAVAEDLPEATPQEQVGLLMVAKTLMDSLLIWIGREGEAKLGSKKPKSGKLYQFKITLLDSKPQIWRRIQVTECTLDKLHEHIQTAMGWTNSHLHQFLIDDHYYGDPLLLEDMGGLEIKDSTATLLSEILPAKGTRFQFTYEYDFGDSWLHKVLFEGSPKPEKDTKYPLCLEGENACPPEDVGGLSGYVNFLRVVSDPKHDDHQAMLKWAGGKFNPEKFSPAMATKAMKKGLPDWRYSSENC